MLIESIDGDEKDVSTTANVPRALALERENNYLPWRIDMLSDAALEALDSLLVKICLHPGRVSRDALAGACLLQAALVTGRPVKTLVSLPIFRIEPSSIKACDPQGLYLGRNDCAWWLAAGKPTSAQNIPPEAEGLYRPVQQNMVIWCGERTLRLGQNAFSRRAWRLKRAIAKPGRRLAFQLKPPNGFESWTTPATRKLTSAALRLLTPSQRHALSAKRVENWLFSRLVEETGELAYAAIITGQVTSKSNALLHYTWVPTENASQMAHSHTARREWIDGDRVCPDLPAYRTAPEGLTDPNIGHGSRFVLTKQAVQGFVQTLLCKLQKGHETEEFHNHFTLYTIALVGFAAGLRPTGPPIPTRSQIYLGEGWLVWNDKARNADNQNRLLWLPPVVTEQIKLYYSYVDSLDKNFSAEKSLLGILNYQNETNHFPKLFCGGALIDASPDIISSELAGLGFPIQPNAWRHYLRTELLGRVPGDALMACMGHWQRGQDPWDVYSAFDPMTYRKVLQERVISLLERDGWIAMSGLPPQPQPPRPLRKPSIRPELAGRPAFMDYGSY